MCYYVCQYEVQTCSLKNVIFLFVRTPQTATLIGAFEKSQFTLLSVGGPGSSTYQSDFCFQVAAALLASYIIILVTFHFF